MGFHSFRGPLSRWVQYANPDDGTMRILEWGPGYSTQIMRGKCLDAEIWTYESEEEWFRKWNYTFIGDPKIYVYHVPLDEDYHNAPRSLGLTFHFIFIDGRERVKCMETAYDLIEDSGIVMLHDSCREEYAPGKALFKVLIEADDTAVMVKI